MAQYGIFFTQLGRDKIASATEGNPLDITHIAVGDGGGGYPDIDDSITSLVNELGRYPISGTSTPAPTQRQFSAVVPPDLGPAVIRERGLIDSDGDLIAIAQAEPIEMPAPGPNAVSVTVGILATFNNADYVRAIVDLQSLVFSSRKVIAGTGLTGGGDLTEDLTIDVQFGSEAGTVAEGDDERITGAASKIYVDEELAKKVDKVSGKGLSTNDYTNDEKTKLAGIETGANKTTVVQSTGSSTTSVMSQKAVTDALLGIGQNQRWSSQVITEYTVYTNSFNRPIGVSYFATRTAKFQVRSGSSASWVTVMMGKENTGDNGSMIIIPSGHQYRLIETPRIFFGARLS